MNNAGIRLHPPLLVALAVAATLVLERLVPLRFAGWPAGAALALAGLALGGWAVWTMRGAGTGVATWSSAALVVRKGPFRRSRNPIYLGLLATMAGVALWAGSGWGLIATAATAATIATAVVPKEEAYLRARFGAVYDDYAARVRRWF